MSSTVLALNMCILDMLLTCCALIKYFLKYRSDSLIRPSSKVRVRSVFYLQLGLSVFSKIQRSSILDTEIGFYTIVCG